ncbi:hypothetical protein Pst134EB_016948 [Puccinia striiformis f. sp. tritici]|nr:hypothetical protein Pst134EB_016948 [Puccinia striiformis f. sp. tritici]
MLTELQPAPNSPQSSSSTRLPINTRSSLTPRATRANTPVRDENHSPLLPPTTPRTPFTNHFNNDSSSLSPSHHRSPISNKNQASSSRTPAHPIAPL